MSNLYSRYTWSVYSKKLKRRIVEPFAAGRIKNAPEGMRLTRGKAGRLVDGNLVAITLVVDESDGIIADARFEAYGDSALIGAADIVCELVLRKNYDQASRIGAELIDMHVRDQNSVEAFPPEVGPHLNLVLTALSEATQSCDDIPLADDYVPPTPFDEGEGGLIVENFEELSHKEKLALIEDVIAKEIRPYVELDAGGVEVSNLEGLAITIAYQGACTTCHSATGATLSAIQHILRRRVHPDLIVIPDSSLLAIS
ncbi:MAG: NifU family protein [Simkaniaceae bacterium]|nr:NifU family protein [Simkaniaceae bacterium]